ncbi:MAG: hypothetical protein IJ945_01830 [Oscillospiraceae bacterium]|nr:hypothetical protein [Oscillospiraceae bacterium]
MEEENLIPGAELILGFVERCASAIDSALKFVGGILPDFIAEDPGALFLVSVLAICAVLWLGTNRVYYTQNPETFFRMSLPWYDAALLLGLGAAYPVDLPAMKGLGFLGWIYFDSVDDPAVTWFNYREWDGFFQTCLVITLIGMVFLGLIFLISRGVQGLIGAWSGLLGSFFIGFCAMNLHGWFYERVCINIMDENFFSGMLNIVLGVPHVIVMIFLPILFVAFFMTPQMMASVIEMGEREERRKRMKKPAAAIEDSDEIFEDGYGSHANPIFPERLRSPNGEIYRLNYAGKERAEYLCAKTGQRESFYSVEFEEGYPSGWNEY